MAVDREYTKYQNRMSKTEIVCPSFEQIENNRLARGSGREEYKLPLTEKQALEVTKKRNQAWLAFSCVLQNRASRLTEVLKNSTLPRPYAERPEMDISAAFLGGATKPRPHRNDDGRVTFTQAVEGFQRITKMVSRANELLARFITTAPDEVFADVHDGKTIAQAVYGKRISDVAAIGTDGLHTVPPSAWKEHLANTRRFLKTLAGLIDTDPRTQYHYQKTFLKNTTELIDREILAATRNDLYDRDSGFPIDWYRAGLHINLL